MLCPKCGYEFEGTSCPKCDAPAILVNASDYERRKREWEEREKTRTEEEGRKRRKKEDIQRIAGEIANTDYKKVLRSKTNSFIAFIVRHRKGLAALSVIAAAVSAAVFTGIRMSAAAERQIYISDGDNIYKGIAMEDRICSAKELVYNRKNDKAYVFELPDGLDANKIISAVCSDNGRYFAAVSYEEDAKSNEDTDAEKETVIGESNSTAVNGNALSDGTYTLYAWEQGRPFYTAASDKKEKVIQNISDKGLLVFTDTEYMNEGVIKSVALLTSDITAQGRGVLYSDDIDEFILTGDGCIWLENNGRLCIRAVGGNVSSVKIDEDVKQIYAGTGRSTFSHKNAGFQDGDTKSFIYRTSGGEFIISDISDIDKPKNRYLFTASEPADHIIYEAGYGCAYTVSQGGVTRYTGIPVKKDAQDKGGRKSEKVSGILSPKDHIYIEESAELYFADTAGTLIKISHRKKGFELSELIENVSSGTLNAVLNSKDSFSFTADNRLYYVKSPKNTALVLTDDMVKEEPAQVLYDNRKLYFIAGEKLYLLEKDSEKAGEIGTAQKIWIGRIGTRQERRLN